ncbi:Centromere protein J [Takifugu flavidus]|uniref:Centromere protein J n=1 Tax=Takifugu flavidus TaxID=433684 RepID=A0A5C6PNH2_9TELE|nr:Centromere protein J [Takifugu flavidus]
MKPPVRREDEAGENRSEENPQSSGDEVPEEVLELSFQEKLQRWECDHHAESMELGEFELLEQAAEELSFSSNSSFVTKILQMDRMRAVHGLPPRRLSSTPVKAPPKGEIRRCSSLGSSGFEDCKADLMNSDALKNKVSVQDAEEERRVFADVWPCGGYHSEGQEILTKESKQPYDKRSYQDEDSASEASQSDDAEGESVLSTAESTLIEDKDEQDRVVFDDNDTWNDQEDTVVPTARESPPPQRTLLRKVAVLDKGAVTGSTNQKSDPPPASELMTKLFPSLKPKTQNAPVPPAPESKQPQEESGQSVQSRLLRERLVELEIEIERFKKENAALTKLREENEKNRDVLRKERLEFEQMKAVELAKLEEYKKEENRRLQKERRIFERHASAARAMPDKKEREEIQLLKQQLSSLQEELKGKESRWASAHNRLRQQIDSLRQENASLRDETRVLEKLRLNALKNNVANAEKVQKMSPKMLENSTSTISKGVKFASPLDSRGSGNPPQSSMAAAARKNSKEGGIKSSLRKPAASESSSTSLSRTVERSTTAGKSQEKSSNPENSHSCSPKHNVLPNEVGSELKEPEPADQVITHSDGKTEKVLTNGDRLVVFPNGTKKEVSADGQTVKVTFFNGDTKEITDQRVVRSDAWSRTCCRDTDTPPFSFTASSHRTPNAALLCAQIYFYAEAQTTHVTYPDGIEVLHFPNNQTEKHFPDGRKEITFPDQTVKNLFPGGREESVLTDGTVIQVNPDGSKEIHFNTGQREIHTADYKRREYPDGTVKTVYNDGRQETRYPTGRLRVKDKDGNVVVDSRG